MQHTLNEAKPIGAVRDDLLDVAADHIVIDNLHRTNSKPSALRFDEWRGGLECKIPGRRLEAARRLAEFDVALCGRPVPSL